MFKKKPKTQFLLLFFCLLVVTQLNAKKGNYLGDLTWQQADKLISNTLVIIPFAAGAKEHGPHLPLKTDQIVLEHLLAAAVEQQDVLVAPMILHGWFPAFREYPGTEIADPTVFQKYVSSIAESLVKHGARRIVFLNMGINKASGLPLSIVARDIRSNYDVPTLVLSWDDLESSEVDAIYEQQQGGHADEGETSIMLHLRPDLVHMDLASKDYRFPKGKSVKAKQIGYAPGKFIRKTEAGLYGDATLATAEKGEKILTVMLKNWLLALNQFRNQKH